MDFCLGGGSRDDFSHDCSGIQLVRDNLAICTQRGNNSGRVNKDIIMRVRMTETEHEHSDWSLIFQ